MSRSQARGWQFWRGAFWRRPALCVVFGVLLVLVGAVVTLAGPGQRAEAHKIQTAPVCESLSDVDCLERVPGYLDGPHYKRGPGSSWALMDGDEHAQGFDSFDMATRQSLQLEGVDQDEVVDGLAWEKDIVAVELPDGTVVHTDTFGDSGWLFLVLLGLFLVAGGFVCLNGAAWRRRAGQDWWSVQEPGAGSHRATLWMVPGVLVGAPAMLGLLPMAVMGSFRLALVGVALGVVLALLGARSVVRRSRGAARAA